MQMAFSLLWMSRELYLPTKYTPSARIVTNQVHSHSSRRPDLYLYLHFWFPDELAISSALWSLHQHHWSWISRIITTAHYQGISRLRWILRDIWSQLQSPNWLSLRQHSKIGRYMRRRRRLSIVSYILQHPSLVTFSFTWYCYTLTGKCQTAIQVQLTS